MSIETAEVLERAADRIERDGWYQGDFFPGELRAKVEDELTSADDFIRKHNPPCCTFGAIIGETANFSLQSAAILALDLHIPVGLVTHWNDEDGRTVDEVLALLREVAALERAKADD